jgi:FAD:protein FMN transferase
LAYTAFDSIALVETEEGVFLQGNKKYALNFNAIAKGYIVQKIGDFLARRGAENYMVEIGGEIALKGLNSDGKPWQIAIEKPILTEKSAQAILSLTDISMATSGNYKQFIESNGEKRSHIINSKTGLPEHSSLIAVTVLHVDCAVADAWATAIMAMGEAKAKELLGQNTDLSVFWISKDEENNLTTAYFNNFDKFMLKNVAK